MAPQGYNELSQEKVKLYKPMPVEFDSSGPFY